MRTTILSAGSDGLGKLCTLLHQESLGEEALSVRPIQQPAKLRSLLWQNKNATRHPHETWIVCTMLRPMADAPSPSRAGMRALLVGQGPAPRMLGGTLLPKMRPALSKDSILMRL